MSQHNSYWSANLKLVALCLVIWFIVSYLFGIILVEPLNTIKIGGYKLGLGFWFAQQGSIYTFIALIFFYAKRMGKLDREHNVHEDDE
jgi:putative solute:sodium symporter small subunit